MKRNFYYEIVVKNKTIMATESWIEAEIICRYICNFKNISVKSNKYKHTKVTIEIFKKGIKSNILDSIKIVNRKLNKEA